MWFEQLFGFAEAGWEETRDAFALDGEVLVAPSGRRFAIGRFATPSLGQLRRAAQARGAPGRVRVTHRAIGDVLRLHALEANRGAMFQVASQLNCLEFASPHIVPEEGITGYAGDATQGPACALAAAAATVYRNYLVPVGGHRGQTHDRQLDTLADLAALLGEPGEYFTVRNGYTFSDTVRLARLPEAMAALDRSDLLEALRIGVQSRVGVTFSERWVEPAAPTWVSQAFCSAISAGYVPGVPVESWRPLATLVLDAAYEATLWAAILDAAEGRGSGRVWLTFLGGGVFANPSEWIGGAIRRAVERVQGFDLDVRVAHYRRIDERMKALVG